MAIEFSCPHCGSLLQVPDDAAGRSTLCPKCEQVTTAPAAAPPEAPRAGESRARESHIDQPINPFAPPTTIEAPLQGSSEIRPTKVTVSDIFNYSFEVWKSNLGILIGAALIIMFATMLINVISTGVAAVVAQGDDGVAALVGGMFGLVDSGVSMFLYIGMSRICLSLCRGRPTGIDLMFSGADRFLPVLGTHILAGFALGIGFLLLIIPGILLVLFFWPYYLLIVDKQSRALDSFSLAYTFAKPNAITSLLLGLLSFAIMIIGVLAFCIGIIAATPLVGVLAATAYLMMKGEIPPGTTPPGKFDAPVQTPAPM